MELQLNYNTLLPLLSILILISWQQNEIKEISIRWVKSYLRVSTNSSVNKDHHLAFPDIPLQLLQSSDAASIVYFATHFTKKILQSNLCSHTWQSYVTDKKLQFKLLMLHFVPLYNTKISLWKISTCIFVNLSILSHLIYIHLSNKSNKKNKE